MALDEWQNVLNHRCEAIEKDKSSRTNFNEPSPHEDPSFLEVTRCARCMVNHFPSLPKFCRWAMEHQEKIKKNGRIIVLKKK